MEAKDMEASLLASLEQRTGRPLAHWTAVARASGLTKHMQVLKHLKDKHGLSYGHANLVAFKFLGTDAASVGDDDALLTAMFAGKEHWRPLYDALAAAVQQLGPDVELAVKKSYVSVRRSKQFAILQPSTKTRFDVGIQLKGHPGTERLKSGGAFNGMTTHRVALGIEAHLDNDLMGWLREAYASA
jgi:hypothetical protein